MRALPRRRRRSPPPISRDAEHHRHTAAGHLACTSEANAPVPDGRCMHKALPAELSCTQRVGARPSPPHCPLSATVSTVTSPMHRPAVQRSPSRTSPSRVHCGAQPSNSNLQGPRTAMRQTTGGQCDVAARPPRYHTPPAAAPFIPPHVPALHLCPGRLCVTSPPHAPTVLPRSDHAIIARVPTARRICTWHSPYACASAKLPYHASRTKHSALLGAPYSIPHLLRRCMRIPEVTTTTTDTDHDRPFAYVIWVGRGDRLPAAARAWGALPDTYIKTYRGFVFAIAMPAAQEVTLYALDGRLHLVICALDGSIHRAARALPAQPARVLMRILNKMDPEHILTLRLHDLDADLDAAHDAAHD
ncbi:hypothetical protein OBBRIDRAFT_828585 [Obba rivulosa]|uniref:Uncharacterized protein n=1 Tax=Obba rivulosa TaxID=1052685 RepID=A0A8E2DKM6_9APHY|nr:hypothetical protein OBBRIDRAFT_828585 [Obba rivulosa]